MYHGRITESELNCLVRSVKKSNSKFILEVGTYRGGTSLNLATLLSDNIILTLDWKKSQSVLIDDKLEYPNLIQVLCDSYKLGSCFSNLFKRKFALVFIDANHHYRFVKSDFENYSSLVAEDGFLAFHDALSPSFNSEGLSEDIDLSKFKQLAIDGAEGVGARKGVARLIREILDDWFIVDFEHSLAVFQRRTDNETNV